MPPSNVLEIKTTFIMNKMKITLVTLLALISLGSCSIGLKNTWSADDSGPRVETTRKIEPFNTLLIKGACDIHYIQASSPSVKIIAPRNIINKVVTSVSNGELSAFIDKKMFISKKPVEIYVYAPTLNGVHIMGSGDFDAQAVNTDKAFTLGINGSGDIQIGKLSCANVNVNVKGSGDVAVGMATCNDAAINIMGSGDADINFDRVRNVSIGIQGSGDVSSTFNRADHVSCNVNGSGDVKLAGDVQEFQKTIRGSGEVNTRGLRVSGR